MSEHLPKLKMKTIEGGLCLLSSDVLCQRCPPSMCRGQCSYTGMWYGRALYKIDIGVGQRFSH